MLLTSPAFFSCAPRAYRTPSGEATYRQEGIASWYGADFHGRRTSSGERYNMYGLTAAHRTLPLGTVARVTHVRSGRKVTVRINDRGPFVGDRIIDLSFGAARKLGMVKEGIAPVVVEAFPPGAGAPGPAPPSSYSIVVGSFRNEENAEKVRSSLAGEYGSVTIAPFRNNRTTYHRVLVGRFPSEEEARRTARSLQSRGYRYFIVRND